MQDEVQLADLQECKNNGNEEKQLSSLMLPKIKP